VIAEATKVCAKCCEEKPLSQFYKRSDRPGEPRAWCKECANDASRAYRRTEEGRELTRLSTLRSKQANAGKALYTQTKHRAKNAGLEFSLTEEWFVEKVNAGVCELTGLPFGRIHENDPYSPSPDRIDNDIGYRDGNGRMILWWLNKAKGTMSEDQFQRCIADLVGAMRDRV